MPTLRLSGAAFDAGDGALAPEEDECVDDLWADGGAGDGDADRLGELAEADGPSSISPPAGGIVTGLLPDCVPSPALSGVGSGVGAGVGSGLTRARAVTTAVANDTVSPTFSIISSALLYALANTMYRRACRQGHTADDREPEQEASLMSDLKSSRPCRLRFREASNVRFDVFREWIAALRILSILDLGSATPYPMQSWLTSSTVECRPRNARPPNPGLSTATTGRLANLTGCLSGAVPVDSEQKTLDNGGAWSVGVTWAEWPADKVVPCNARQAKLQVVL